MDPVLEEWRRRVAAEYRSAAITAQAVHWMIVAALPEELVTDGLRVVQDELDHARLSHDCLVALGGSDQPAALDPSALQASSDDGLLAGLVDSVVVNFCLGETLAVPLFAAMRRHATHPAVTTVLDRIIVDEARHRRFAWDALDALLALEPEGVRNRVSAQLPSALADLRSRYAPGGDDPPSLSEKARDRGLLPLAEYERIARATIAGELTRRFGTRNIVVEEPADA